jgi:hypothetical protein
MTIVIAIVRSSQHIVQRGLVVAVIRVSAPWLSELTAPPSQPTATVDTGSCINLVVNALQSPLCEEALYQTMFQNEFAVALETKSPCFACVNYDTKHGCPALFGIPVVCQVA